MMALVDILALIAFIIVILGLFGFQITIRWGEKDKEKEVQ